MATLDPALLCQYDGAPRDLHSFPTRRSSDLTDASPQINAVRSARTLKTSCNRASRLSHCTGSWLTHREPSARTCTTAMWALAPPEQVSEPGAPHVCGIRAWSPCEWGISIKITRSTSRISISETMLG